MLEMLGYRCVLPSALRTGTDSPELQLSVAIGRTFTDVPVQWLIQSSVRPLRRVKIRDSRTKALMTQSSCG